MSSGVKTFNFIRNNSTEAFVNVVPAATEDNILQLQNILFNDAYQPQLNEFVNNLINRIALTIVRTKSFDNPLAMFKKGSVPLGTDVQDLYENPAEAEAYEYSNTAMAKLLTITDPDTHVAYYRRNRKDLYTKTITREGLQGAFVSWDKFEDYITSITQSLYSGNYIDEFKYTKALIDGAYANDKAIVQTVSDPSGSEANAKAFVKAVRKLYKKMTFPSTSYNAYSKFSGAKGTITTWTTPDRICLIIKSDAMADVDVDVLAAAFNMDKANLMGRIIEVDSFENPNIVGVICDEAWLQIYDNVFRFDEFYNARVMAWNEYLHSWGTFAISPFANAVILATAAPVAATAVSLGNDVELVLGTDEYEDITVTITPNNATSPIEYTSSNPGVFVVTKLANNKVRVTPRSLGEGTLTASTEGGDVTDTATISVVAEASGEGGNG
jgi:hypothetical protein